MIRLLTLLLLALIPLGAAAAPCPGTRHAVVIGINGYGHGVPALQGARQDAQAMAQALEARGFRVTALLDGAATRDALREVLGLKLMATRPEDQVLVYFAGHGETVGEGRPMGYLLPADAQADKIAVTGLSMGELVGWMEAWPARQRLFIADACYSGLALPGVRSIQRAEPEIAACPSTALPVTAAIVAGRKGDKAHESGAGGVFTQRLLAVLNGQTAADPNGDGWISHAALGGYLSEAVQAEVRARYGAQQVPQVAHLGDGQFMLPIAPAVDRGSEPPPRPAPGPRPRPKPTPEDIQSIAMALQRNPRWVKDCFRTAPIHPGAQVALEVIVSPSGRVLTVSTRVARKVPNSVLNCLASAASRQFYPRPSAAVAVTHTFTPSDKPHEGRWARLSVGSSKPGRKVWLNGTLAGKTPVSELALAPGQYEVRVERDKAIVNLPAGEGIKLIHDDRGLSRPSQAPGQ
ncbi:MAG: caspase family protein [Myxococcales bacterium]|nr:caspase family protein [Myxococcales bacterium]MCB9522878.1 caspase family protein [Myxococcales bacterium]